MMSTQVPDRFRAYVALVIDAEGQRTGTSAPRTVLRMTGKVRSCPA